MSLAAFLYLCPECGHDPLLEDRGRVRCPDCLRSFELGSGGTTILVSEAGGEGAEIPAATLAGRLDAVRRERVGRVEGSGSDGGLHRTSMVSMRIAVQEDPIHRNGALLGFVERRGPRRLGTLSLRHDVLQFEGVDGEGVVWRLLDLRAVQSTSSSVQVSPRTGGVVTFRFDGDSPLRWEDLLKSALRSTWRSAGRGEILEFQPRIRARAEIG